MPTKMYLSDIEILVPDFKVEQMEMRGWKTVKPKPKKAKADKPIEDEQEIKVDG